MIVFEQFVERLLTYVLILRKTVLFLHLTSIYTDINEYEALTEGRVSDACKS